MDHLFQEVIMSEPFIYFSTYAVREGHLDEALDSCRDVARLVESREPRMLVFHFFADESGRQITCLQVHAESESMANHMSLISEHLARSGSWLESFSNAVALGEAPAVMTQWYQEAGEQLARFPRHVAGVTRVGAPVG
ncbi:hypothetical protein DBR22_04925 [Arthrobacter sp. HMWF013]|nr:hypothetical protein DBR22_04925 [Arthrobacter sp. HMWF013]